MAQVTSGLRSILSRPMVYELFQTIIGGERKRQKLVAEYIRPNPGMRILDVGCGPAAILDHLPADVEYVGVDLSPAYIDQAKKRYGDRGIFLVQAADRLEIEGRPFDLAMALGLLHHLEDDEALALLRAMKSKVCPGGRVMTFDGVYTADQSAAARFFLRRDRGQNVRWESGYLHLARRVFGDTGVCTHIRSDMTRIPYTHCLMECRV